MTSELLQAAERLFDEHGFNATGMDLLTEAAGMSSRTLYKHAGSKAKLAGAVLTERGRRFMRRIEVDSVDAMFAANEEWMREEGARGCLFLRLQSETGSEISEIVDAVSAHKVIFAERVAAIVAADLGKEDPFLSEQIIVLFEGVVHAFVYRGNASASAAREAARLLVERARP